MTITITLSFPNAEEASHALARLTAPQQFATATIAHLDRPDVGAEVALPVIPAAPAVVTPEQAFAGAAVVPVPPTPAPSAPFAATVPIAAPAPAAATTTPDLDVNGVAWDASLHSTNKSKNKDGSWRAKRVTGAAAEAPPAPPAAPVAPVAPPAPVALPPAPPAAAPAAPADTSAVTTFAGLMQMIHQPFTNEPVKAHNAMAAVLAPLGVANLNLLAQPANAPLIPGVASAFLAAFAQ